MEKYVRDRGQHGARPDGQPLARVTPSAVRLPRRRAKPLGEIGQPLERFWGVRKCSGSSIKRDAGAFTRWSEKAPRSASFGAVPPLDRCGLFSPTRRMVVGDGAYPKG